MLKIREIRETIDTKLDQWEAGAMAAESLLQQTKDQALSQFELRKKQLSETLEAFKSELTKAKGITNENKQQIQAKFDELRFQLALGKADAKTHSKPREKRSNIQLRRLKPPLTGNWRLQVKLFRSL